MCETLTLNFSYYGKEQQPYREFFKNILTQQKRYIALKPNQNGDTLKKCFVKKVMRQQHKNRSKHSTESFQFSPG